MDVKSVKISMLINLWDHFNATMAVVTRMRSIKFGYIFFVIIPLTLMIVFILRGVDMSGPGAFGLNRWGELLLGPIFMFIFLPLLRLYHVWSERRMNHFLCEVQTFTVATSGFEIAGGAFEVKLKWEAIQKVLEIKHYFLLYILTHQAYFIPKKAITTPADLLEIRTILREGLGNGAHLYKTV